MLPKIRNSEELLIAELEGQVVVYDSVRNKRHNLNPALARVFQLCDGKTTPQQMAACLQQEMKLNHPEQVIWIALDWLERADLLAAELIRPQELDVGYTRSMA